MASPRFELISVGPMPLVGGPWQLQFFRSQITGKADPLLDALLYGCLCAHWGEPSSDEAIDRLFWIVLDKIRNVQFACVCRVGTYYAAAIAGDLLAPSLHDFEAFVAKLPSKNCEIQLSDARLGVRRGKPFIEDVEPATCARTTLLGHRTYEACVAAVNQHSKQRVGNMFSAWQQCLEKVMPTPPAEFEYGSNIYTEDDSIGFGFSDKKNPVYGFDIGNGVEEIPVAKIPWPKPLPATAALWLTSYERWRKDKRK